MPLLNTVNIFSGFNTTQAEKANEFVITIGHTSTYGRFASVTEGNLFATKGFHIPSRNSWTYRRTMLSARGNVDVQTRPDRSGFLFVFNRQRSNRSTSE